MPYYRSMIARRPEAEIQLISGLRPKSQAKNSPLPYSAATGISEGGMLLKADVASLILLRLLWGCYCYISLFSHVAGPSWDIDGRGVEKTRPGTKTLHDVPYIIMYMEE